MNLTSKQANIFLAAVAVFFIIGLVGIDFYFGARDKPAIESN